MAAGIVIQARMGSKRFPGKVLKDLGETSLLGQVLKRVQMLNNFKVIVATTTLEEDEDIVDFCSRSYICYFYGELFYEKAIHRSFKRSSSID